MHLKIKKMIFTFFIVCLFNISIIYNVNSIGGSVSGGLSGISNHTYSGTSFYSSFEYVPRANGYRVSIVDSTGKRISGSNSVDYWTSWYGGAYANQGVKYGYKFIEYAMENSIPYHVYKYCKNKKPKTEENNDLKCGEYSGVYSTNDNITKQDFLLDDKNADYKKYYSYINQEYNGTNDAVSNKRLGLAFGPGDSTHANNYIRYVLKSLEYAMKNVKTDGKKVFLQYIKNSGLKGSDSELLSKMQGNYMVVEPLSAIYTQGGKNSNCYIGTSYELSQMLFFEKETGIVDSYIHEYFPYTNPVVYNTKQTNFINACSSGDANLYDKINTNLKDKKGCSGAFIIDLNDIAPPCNQLVNEAYKNYYLKHKESDYDNELKKISGCSTKNCEHINADNIKKFNLKESDIVCDPGCNYLAQRIYNKCFGKDNCSDGYSFIGKKTYKTAIDKLLEIYENNITGIGSTYYTDEKFLKSGLIYKNKFCQKTSCWNLYNEAKKNNNDLVIKLLYGYYKDIDLSSEDADSIIELYESQNITPCDDTILEICNVESTGDCSSGNLVFKTSQDENCIKANIAYNAYKSKINLSILQQSYNSHYSNTLGVKVYCSEEVKFELPQEASVKAGTLLKWGINVDDKQNIFSNMYISQKCYTSNPIPVNKKITWNDSLVNTRIEVKYDDPSDLYDINSPIELNGNAVNPTFEVKNDAFNDDAFEKETLIAGEVDYVVKKSNIRSFNVNIRYNFRYGNDLTWYSGKGLDSNIIKKDVFSSFNNKQYLFIGYGFPTSFSTVDGKYSGLTAKIYNIGTSNIRNGTSKFDNYVQKQLNKKDGYDYSCDYNIHNELFGYECYDENGNLLENAPNYCIDKVKDIDVVFRTIELVDSSKSDTVSINNELNTAFSGRSGKGLSERGRGRNWSLPNVTDLQVLNILSSNIYDEQPMYHFVLDVSLIKEIRNANSRMRARGYEPYNTWVSLDQQEVAYSGFSCDDKDGKKYCASHFLSYLAGQSAYSKKITGKCIEVSKSNEDTRATNGPCGQEWWNE